MQGPARLRAAPPGWPARRFRGLHVAGSDGPAGAARVEATLPARPVRRALAQLAELRVADTTGGSGGFLIKVLRAFWRQYQRVDAACVWVQKTLKPDNGELYLAELPPNVEAALAFRRRHHFDNRRELAARVVERHVRVPRPGPVARNVMTLCLARACVNFCHEALGFRGLVGRTRAFPNFRLVLGPAHGACGAGKPSRDGKPRVRRLRQSSTARHGQAVPQAPL